MKRIEVAGFLDDAQAERIVAAMRAAAGQPIDLRIDSHGGKFAAMVVILLEAEERSAPVFTTVVEAGSAAGVLAIAGDVRRIDRKGALMLHYATPPSREAGEEMRGLIGEYTRATPAAIAGWLAREQVFDAAAALRAGLADRIIDASAPDAVWLKAPPKRRPAEWLKGYRDFCERLDLR